MGAKAHPTRTRRVGCRVGLGHLLSMKHAPSVLMDHSPALSLCFPRPCVSNGWVSALRLCAFGSLR
jgi:hypothetical protein